ncbi:hypothetical protein MP228_008085 [Amoeboaphelidium protococcarum]|nr:hypothetical protein MP228_008085 [Amoeboaphelidium protococcarum]
MSSVALQLQKLKQQQAQSLNDISVKQRASLLFDQKKAATIDDQQIFNLALEGLRDIQELVGIDGHSAYQWKELQTTLFAKSLLDVDVFILPPDQFSAIKTNVAQFMRLISSHLMHRAAVKCLEWLIRKFKVNEIMVDEYVSLFLPYHQTKLFLKALQLLTVEMPAYLRPLDPLVKANVSPDRDAVVKCFKKAPNQLYSILTQAMDASTGGLVHFRFGIVCMSSLISSDVAGSLVNGDFIFLVSKAMKHGLEEVQCGGIMLVAQVAGMHQLSEEYLQGLCEMIIQTAIDVDTKFQVFTLIAANQTRPINFQLWKSLCGADGFESTLQSALQQNQLAENVLNQVMKCMAQIKMDVVVQFVKDGLLTEDCIKTILRQLVEISTLENSYGIQDLLRQVEQRCSHLLQEVVGLDTYISGLESADQDNYLFLKLRHHDASIRTAACQKLLSQIDASTIIDESLEQDFQRLLLDDNPDFVKLLVQNEVVWGKLDKNIVKDFIPRNWSVLIEMTVIESFCQNLLLNVLGRELDIVWQMVTLALFPLLTSSLVSAQLLTCICQLREEQKPQLFQSLDVSLASKVLKASEYDASLGIAEFIASAAIKSHSEQQAPDSLRSLFPYSKDNCGSYLAASLVFMAATQMAEKTSDVDCVLSFGSQILREHAPLQQDVLCDCSISGELYPAKEELELILSDLHRSKSSINMQCLIFTKVVYLLVLNPKVARKYVPQVVERLISFPRGSYKTQIQHVILAGFQSEVINSLITMAFELNNEMVTRGIYDILKNVNSTKREVLLSTLVLLFKIGDQLKLDSIEAVKSAALSRVCKQFGVKEMSEASLERTVIPGLFANKQSINLFKQYLLQTLKAPGLHDGFKCFVMSQLKSVDSYQFLASISGELEVVVAQTAISPTVLGVVINWIHRNNIVKLCNKFEEFKALYETIVLIAQDDLVLAQVYLKSMNLSCVGKLPHSTQKQIALLILKSYGASDQLTLSMLKDAFVACNFNELVVISLIRDVKMSDIQSGSYLNILLELLTLRYADRIPSNDLVAAIFRIFAEMMSTNEDGRDQIVLQNVMILLGKLVASTLVLQLAGDVYRVDLLMRMITEQNDQRSKVVALNLIAAICKQCPMVVLPYVMQVFTFMGSNMVKQDDAYSWKIVEDTVCAILPPLASSSQEDKGTDIDVIHIFAQAQFNIPIHRRLKLVNLVLCTMGIDKYGHLYIMAVLKAYYVSKDQNVTMDEDPMGFCVAFVQKLVLSERGQVLTNLVLGAVELLIDNQSRLRSTMNVRKDAASMKLGGYTLRLVNKCVQDYPGTLVDSHESMLQSVISLQAYLSTMPSKKVGPVMSIVENLAKTLTVSLPIQKVVELGCVLLEEQQVQQLGVNVLLEKFVLQSGSVGVDNALIESLVSLVIKCGLKSDQSQLPVLRLFEQFIKKIEGFATKNALSIIDALHIQVEKLANEDFAQFMEIISDVLIAALERFQLKLLPKLKIIVELFQRMLSCTQAGHYAHGTFVGLKLVFDFFASFSSSFLGKTIVLLGECTDKQFLESQHGEALLLTMAGKVPTDILISEMIKCSSACGQSFYIELLRQKINLQTKDSIGQSYKQLFKLFVVVFDQLKDQEMEGISEVFTQFVIKLTQSMFDPLYSRLSDWAQRSILNHCKMLSILSSLLQSCQSLMVPYVFAYSEAILLQLSGAQLDGYSCGLSIEVLGKMFEYDQDGVLKDDALKSFIDPLVRLVQCNFDEVQSKLHTCVGNLLLLTKDNNVIKHLNTSILEKMRHQSADVRKRAISLLRYLYSQNGDSLLAFLPESMPVIAELLEDDDEEVEKKCRELIRVIEGCLGESLDEHLK